MTNGTRYTEKRIAWAMRLLAKPGATATQVAERVGASERTVRRWARAREVVLAGRKLYDHSEIKKRLAAGGVAEAVRVIGCSHRTAQRVQSA